MTLPLHYFFAWLIGEYYAMEGGGIVSGRTRHLDLVAEYETLSVKYIGSIIV